MRFKDAFDVLIIDEIDAFPFAVDESLTFAVNKARKAKSALIYLSATPTKKMQEAIQRKQLVASILPARYHGYPLPEPSCIWLGLHSESKFAMRKFVILIQNCFKQQRRVLLFMPTIKMMLWFEEELKRHFPKQRIASASSKDTDRKIKVQEMRNNQLDLLLTTTILERGVTFVDIDVLVYATENRIFTTSALVQIAGRAGRHKDYPKGAVIFLHHGRSRGMKQAVSQIKKMNVLAAKRGLLKQ